MDHAGCERGGMATLRFNVWQDWGGAADMQFPGAGFSVPLLDHATRLEFAGGLTYKMQSNLSFYTQAGYEVRHLAGRCSTRRLQGRYRAQTHLVVPRGQHRASVGAICHI
jgi:hypothetical protein